jgi:hypothetical protein
MLMKFKAVLILLICLGQQVLGQEYSGSIRLDRIKDGFKLQGSDKSEIGFKLKHDTIPTLTLDGKELEFISSRLKIALDTIVIRSVNSQSKLVRIKGGYETANGTKYVFNKCKTGEWIWCGGTENNSNDIYGSYKVSGNKSLIRLQIHAALKDREIAGLMICRLIFESSLIYNAMNGKGGQVGQDSETFWLIHLTSNM